MGSGPQCRQPLHDLIVIANLDEDEAAASGKRQPHCTNSIVVPHLLLPLLE
jgi:hypothetical protein